MSARKYVLLKPYVAPVYAADPHEESVIKWMLTGLENEQVDIERALRLAYSMGLLYKKKDFDVKAWIHGK